MNVTISTLALKAQKDGLFKISNQAGKTEDFS
jgi:hypothetical protein